MVALLEIIKEQGGGPVPGAAQVARRAGVSERTVFRHFADLDSLFLAAATQQRPIFATYLTPRPGMAELDKRIAAIARLHSALFEEIAPVRRVALRVAMDHPSLGALVEEANRAARRQLEETFLPELKRAGGKRRLLLDELDLVTNWFSWDALRTGQASSAVRARKAMADLMTVILSPYAPRAPRHGPSRSRSAGFPPLTRATRGAT